MPIERYTNKLSFLLSNSGSVVRKTVESEKEVMSMVNVADLEARVKALEDIEAIKRLKYKYFRCIDNKLWDEMAGCFIEDATTSYSDGKYRFKGTDEIMQFMKKRLGQDSSIGIHQGHHPEIELTSDTTARGTWAFYVYMIDKQERSGFRMAGFYHDEYARQKGEWKIKSTGFTRIFEEIWDRDESRSLKLIASRGGGDHSMEGR